MTGSYINMYHRECQRRNNGLARMVPHLREIHVLRDAYTKLNVIPAKIMQVRFTSLMCVFTCALSYAVVLYHNAVILVFFYQNCFCHPARACDDLTTQLHHSKPSTS